MRVCVTGSAGFVGRHLVERLRADGMDVVGIDRAQGPDLADPSCLSTLPHADVVVHLAARTFVPDSFNEPAEFYRVNLNSTLHILEHCRAIGAYLVFASSYIYGTPRNLPIREDHPPSAHNPYAETKIMGELLCRGYFRDFGVPSFIVRPFNIYGPGQQDHFLIPTIIRQAAAGQVELKDPRPRRDYVYIDDVTAFYRLCLNRKPEGVEVFNLGAGMSVSVEQLARKIIQFYPSASLNFTGEARKQEVFDTVASVERATMIMKWRPAVSLDEGLARCVDAQNPRKIK